MPRHSRTKFHSCPSSPFFFFPFLLILSLTPSLLSKWPSESFTVSLYVLFSFQSYHRNSFSNCHPYFRTTVAPSPSWSLPSTTTWTLSWFRLRPMALPTPPLSTARSSPLARSLLSRVPTASLCPRSLLSPSTVRVHNFPRMF